ncbi:MAG: dihydropteroate synthase [Spirochaetales bacterium]|nr:dihydropteroate synthase [Spirochaetales bacterium]
MILNLSGRTLKTKRKAFVMGILNTTPDSFYADSRACSVENAVSNALKMIEEGADIIDIGGESTRPGSDYVEADEEIRRVVPVIKELRKVSGIAVSVDTRKAIVAEQAIDAGADIINDISALSDDPALAGLIAERNVPVILMHMRGTPRNMQKNPSYDDVIKEISEELEERISYALNEGIEKEKIIIDPGIGFSKRIEDNLSIIRHLDNLTHLGYPVLMALSRKSFIGHINSSEVQDRLTGTLVADMFSVINGASILRVHDVKEHIDMLDMFSAIEGV